MNDPERMTPEQARQRFGDLRVASGAHREFEAPEGLWRPEFGPGLTLEGYRLYAKPKKLGRKPAWRPRRR